MIPNSASLRDPRVLTRSLPLILPCRAPCGSLIRSFQLLTLAGLLMQSFSAIASIPERLPKPPGSREPSFHSPVCLVTALRSGCPPWATQLTFPLDMRYRAGVLALRAPSYLGFRSTRKLLTCQDRRVKNRTRSCSHVECGIFSRSIRVANARRSAVKILQSWKSCKSCQPPPPRSPRVDA